MLGIKKIALLISAAAAIVVVIKDYVFKVNSQNGMVIYISILSMFFFWASVVNRSWVRAAANNYARQLILSCDTLNPPGSQKGQRSYKSKNQLTPGNPCKKKNCKSSTALPSS